MPLAGTLPPPAHPWETQTWKIIVSTAVGFALSALAVLLRLLSRFLSRKQLDWSDWLIVAAFVFKLGLDIVSVFLIENGIGRHINVIPLSTLTDYLKALYAGAIIYTPCVALIKLSILALYWIAFPTVYIRYSVIALSGIVTAWTIACTIVALAACLPIHKSWYAQTPGHCIDTKAYFYGMQIPNIITDFAILLVPLKAISDLKLGKAMLPQLFSVFAIGMTACVFDIIRLVTLLRLSRYADLTWHHVSAWIWTELEPSVAMLAACMPAMGPLLHLRQLLRFRSRDLHPTSMQSAGDRSSAKD